MRVVTSTTAFNDAIGVRISISYSEIDDQTGQVISDNKRIDRVVTDSIAIQKIQAVREYAQEILNNLPST